MSKSPSRHDSDEHPVDSASLDLCGAMAILSLLMSQFDSFSDGPKVNQDDIHASLFAASKLVASAKDTINEMGLVDIPERRAA